MTDSPRWCGECNTYGTHHTDKHTDSTFTSPYSDVHRNRIRCRICGDIVESTDRHDFASCSCLSCSADGGTAYLRRVWDSSKGDVDEVFEELSDWTEYSIIYDLETIVVISRTFVAEYKNGEKIR